MAARRWREMSIRLYLGAALQLCFAASSGSIINDVRQAIAQNDFALADREIQSYRTQSGVTPEWIEALSWLARGALTAKRFDQADGYAAETRRLAIEALKTRKLDDETHLPLALGAAIEVHALSLDARGERGEAVAFLERERKAYGNTSIGTRIQKNINLLSLVGKPAPPLVSPEWLVATPPPFERLKGHAVLLFFWAHWCPDCKAEAPVLAKLLRNFGDRGLVLIGPTQRYGYIEGGEDAAPLQENRYIEQVRRQFYGALNHMAVPIGEDNFKSYGASTTPTIVLLDKNGIVRLYHPGAMLYEDLAVRIRQLINE